MWNIFKRVCHNTRTLNKKHPSMHIIVVKSETHPLMHTIVLKSKAHTDPSKCINDQTQIQSFVGLHS